LFQEIHTGCGKGLHNASGRRRWMACLEMAITQKEGFAEILSDGSNTLDIRVNRRTKLLVRKEAALEVSWPNPHSAVAQYTSPLAPASTLSK
jgi:hypothetical protein